MPERVGDYYNLMPLDSSQANVPHKSRTFRYQTIGYKATHIRTNAICYLKRIMGMNEVLLPERVSFCSTFLRSPRVQITHRASLRCGGSVEEDGSREHRPVT